VRTSAADYRNVWDFLENYQGVLDSNVGSLMFPLRFGDECTCETDEIPTDTLQEWLWRWGHAEMPSLKNTKTVGV